jgi:hypothetical protein
VARDIALLLRRKYLLGCVMILHDDNFSHYSQNGQRGLVFRFEQPTR